MAGSCKLSLLARGLSILSVLIGINIMLFVFLAIISTKYHVLLTPSILAFTFGLRHAVDADHIAAIDNVTRKLLRDGQKPLTVGLWFSLGHSTVVVIICSIIIAGNKFIRDNYGYAGQIGKYVGTAVSASVLFIIGFVNLFLTRKLWLEWQNPSLRFEKVSEDREHSHDGGLSCISKFITKAEIIVTGSESLPVRNDDQNEKDDTTSFLFACCKCLPVLLKTVDKPWKMYPVGFLFGLGFDTSSEIALISIVALSGGQSGNAMHPPPQYVLLLPFLFAAGMSLLDTIDGMVMLWAYSFALTHPKKKLFFNLFITGMSALIAIFIGLLEVLGCISDEIDPKPTNKFWKSVNYLNNNLETVGFGIIAFFIISTLIAIILCKYCISFDVSEDCSSTNLDLRRPLLPIIESKSGETLSEFEIQRKRVQALLLERLKKQMNTSYVDDSSINDNIVDTIDVYKKGKIMEKQVEACEIMEKQVEACAGNTPLTITKIDAKQNEKKEKYKSNTDESLSKFEIQRKRVQALLLARYRVKQ